MMKATITAVGCAALLLGLSFAQEHEDFDSLMKTTSGSYSSLRKSVTAKEGADATAAADKLAGVFEQVQAHFAEHHMEDGVNFAKTGHDAAKNASAAAAAGDWDKASAEVRTIGGTCQGCHAAHRERQPDGSFKMK